jgi:hypothetical protein
MDQERKLNQFINEPQPEWCRAAYTRNFPLPFEEGLKFIVGKGIRHADRHKAFRDFLRAIYRERVKDEQMLESTVAKWIEQHKQQGFTMELFKGAAELFLKWKPIRAKAKASKASSKRWNKEIEKNSLSGTDFAKKALSIFPAVI